MKVKCSLLIEDDLIIASLEAEKLAVGLLDVGTPDHNLIETSLEVGFKSTFPVATQNHTR